MAADDRLGVPSCAQPRSLSPGPTRTALAPWSQDNRSPGGLSPPPPRPASPAPRMTEPPPPRAPSPSPGLPPAPQIQFPVVPTHTVVFPTVPAGPPVVPELPAHLQSLPGPPSSPAPVGPDPGWMQHQASLVRLQQLQHYQQQPLPQAPHPHWHTHGSAPFYSPPPARPLSPQPPTVLSRQPLASPGLASASSAPSLQPAPPVSLFSRAGKRAAVRLSALAALVGRPATSPGGTPSSAAPDFADVFDVSLLYRIEKRLRSAYGQNINTDAVNIAQFMHIIPHFLLRVPADMMWEQMFGSVDTNRDGMVTAVEMTSFLGEVTHPSHTPKLLWFFRYFDESAAGVWSLADIGHLERYLKARVADWATTTDQAAEAISQICSLTSSLRLAPRVCAQTWMDECGSARYPVVVPLLSHFTLATKKSKFQALEAVKKLNYPEFDMWMDKHKPVSVRLDDVISSLTTGDILLCNGRERFSRWIQRATWSVWSHMAMIIRDPPQNVREVYALNPTESVFVLESDTETNDHRPGGGVQMIPIRQRLMDPISEYGHDGLVCIRCLTSPLFEPRDWKSFPALPAFLISICGIPYETSKAELVRSVNRTNTEENLETLFCSEVVAAAYKAMGLLAASSISNNFVPRDFTSDYPANIALLRGALLAKEKRLFLLDPPGR